MHNNNAHWAIFLSNKANKKLLTNQLLNKEIQEIFTGLTNLQGVLFSAMAIKELIEEEALHDEVKVATATNRYLRSLSGGEQKKALLTYLLAKQPGFIIADDPFDNLDIASLASLKEMFQQISTQIRIIQLINRKEDLLPFIKNTAYLQDNNTLDFSEESNLNNDNHHPAGKPLFFKPIPATDKVYSIINNPLIQFNNVTVQYEERAIVKNINWQINGGEFWHLIGPNGAGKTTLLSMITGDNPKGYGQDLLLFGKRKGSGESVWSIKEKIGYFTSAITDLFSRHTTVEQMVISGFFDSIGLYIYPSARQIKLADEWLLLIDMLSLKKKLFHTLSLGQQRMILIVRAMVKHPPLLILDEPTVNLDDDNAAMVVGLINNIAASSKTAILYVSHRQEKGLTPQLIFELTPGDNGSSGKRIETSY